MRKLILIILLISNVLYGNAGKATLNDSILKIKRITALNNSSVSLPVTAENIVNIGAFSLKIKIDTSVITFNGIEETFNNIPVSHNINSGTITLGWFDISGSSSISITDGILFKLKFDFIEGMSNVNFIVGECEFADGNGYSINNIVYIDGRITEYFDLSKPVLLFPLNQSSTDTVVSLIWSSVKGATEYNLQLASDSLFLMIIFNDSTILDTLFMLSSLEVNKTYYWRMRAKNDYSSGSFSEIFSFTAVVASVQNDIDDYSTFNLSQNYPNPFNSITRIRYLILEPMLVKVMIYDVSGREVADLQSEVKAPGEYEIEWNVNDTRKLSSGIYFCLIKAGNVSKSIKLVLMK
jgi:hypothetical protein